MPKVAAATNNLPKTVNPVPTMEKNTSFTQWLLLLLSLLVPLIQSEVVESTVKECKVDECIKQDSCPYFPTVLDDLEEELNRDTEKYKEMVDVVKELDAIPVSSAGGAGSGAGSGRRPLKVKRNQFTHVGHIGLPQHGVCDVVSC